MKKRPQGRVSSLSFLLLAGTIALAFIICPPWPWGLWVAVLLGGVFWHQFQLGRLRAWLAEPTPDALPSASGQWQEVFYRLARMSKLLERTTGRRGRALDRFSTLAAAVPDALVLLDEDNRILWCNLAAEPLLGIRHDKDRGREIHFLIRQQAFSDYLLRQDQEIPFIFRWGPGRGSLLQVQVIPYAESEKLLFVRDLSFIQKQALCHQDLVANVSHELRTPITVISGFIETIGDSPDAGKAFLRYAPLMQEQVARMQKLAEGLLSLSRLEGLPSPRLDEPFALSALMRLAYGDLEALSRGRHELFLDPVPEIFIKGSLEELRSALSNLTGNAVRHTPRGGRIGIRAHLAEGDLLIAVEDCGEGIEAHHLPRLTERFYRADPSRSSATGGTGLGLAIVKQVVERHHGKLLIESEPGKGSVFSLLIPAYRLAAAPEHLPEQTALP